MVGSNRILPSVSIVHPLGDPNLPPDKEKELRRRIVEKALEALNTEIEGQRVFERPQ